MPAKPVKVQKVLAQALERVKPSLQELESEREKAHELIEKIMSIPLGQVRAAFVGSAERNTHLRGDKDIDLFVLFPESMPEEVLEKNGLKIGLSLAKGHEHRVMHASHPYVEAVIDGFDVEIVPAFDVRHASLLKSAVDRTPFHAEYVKKNLEKWQCDEVRLLKSFLKGLGLYGAEISVKGFSGYLCELLVLKHSTFLGVLEAASKWAFGEKIDLESHSSKEFANPLIVIDPVDRNRNVAAPVSSGALAKFIHYSRLFLKKPSIKFFEKHKPKPKPLSLVKKAFKERGIFLVVKTAFPEVVEDVALSQLQAAKERLYTMLEFHEFKMHRTDVLWNPDNAYLLFELEVARLPGVALRQGPKVADLENSEKFVAKAIEANSRAWIDHGHWFSEKKRRFTDARDLMENALRDIRKGETSFVSHVAKAFKKKSELLDNAKVIREYSKDKHFALGFSEYLFKRERWLEEREI
ncbi:MAG TPA: CCA tRNA nucleotidyltransferase [archaeon]|nr:CCA tRNA nucleotidyltransferase [archaeon]